jgi:hypothetical protein
MVNRRAVFLSLCLAIGVTPAQASERPVLVELFTSEGCSSCPRADALLAELATRPDVLALSFHVDYWDRLGWKDPFSSHQATERQSRYATLLDLATVYTPQIVVDGKWQTVGSDRTDVERALDKARLSRQDIPVTLTLDHGQARVSLGRGDNGVAVAVLLIGFDRRHVTAVKRGENRGRTLAHVDVVRGIEEIARSGSNAGLFDASIPWSCDRVAAVVQSADGRILGVAVQDVELP